MGIPYFTINMLKESTSFIDPITARNDECSIAAAMDLVQNWKDKNPPQNDLSKIQHWWSRKWYIPLDYYLLSPCNKEPTKRGHFEKKTFRKVEIKLPKELPDVGLNPIDALLKRKTYRKFKKEALSIKKFSAILGQSKEGIFKGIWRYYLVIFNIEGLDKGLYTYCPLQHGLSKIKLGNFREECVNLLCGMTASLSASFLVIYSLDLKSIQKEFLYSRALREVYIDAGRLAQKLILKGMQYYVGGLPSPAMKDEEMCNFLEINSLECIPIYTLSMGIIPGTKIQ